MTPTLHHHRRRLRQHAWAMHGTTLTLMVVGGLWIGAQAVICWNGRATPWQHKLCNVSVAAPCLLLTCMLGICSAILRHMVHLGRAIGPRPGEHPALCGYRALEDARRHVHASVASLGLGASAFLATALYWHFYIEAVWIIGLAAMLALIVYVGVRTLLRQAISRPHST